MPSGRFIALAAALLAGLACTALAVSRAVPANHFAGGHRSSAASAAAAAAAVTRRGLRGIETSVELDNNVTTKGFSESVDSFVTSLGNDLTYGLSNVFEHLSGGCNHGNWCGEKCVGAGGEPIDTLDERCQEHDSCLSTASDSCESCLCHAKLIDGIRQMMEDSDCTGDNWAGDRCQSMAEMKEAPSIAAGIDFKMGMDSCASQAWKDGCPSTVYDYEIKIKTRCALGAGTDGDVRLRLTSSDGTVYETDYLDGLGNDRVMCMEDPYRMETTATKVLMNCDTTCQVYFKPKWAFPDWQPEYVRVSRSSNNDQTYSVRYCMDGILSEEGWYTFYCCD